MFEKKIDDFVASLQKYISPNENIFNPWKDTDDIYDINETAPIIRSNNLKNYLKSKKNAKIALIAEALSYQGGKFTGIAMTAERHIGIRTSKPDYLKNNMLKEYGFSEPTGSIVNRVMNSLLSDESLWVKWNIFPFQPHKSGNNLSNRTPTDEELNSAKNYFDEFLKIFPDIKIIAVGNTSKNMLTNLGLDVQFSVRHPANGGATLFENGMKEIISKLNLK